MVSLLLKKGKVSFYNAPGISHPFCWSSPVVLTESGFDRDSLNDVTSLHDIMKMMLPESYCTLYKHLIFIFVCLSMGVSNWWILIHLHVDCNSAKLTLLQHAK